MNSTEITKTLTRLSFLLELNGESPFKTRAYDQLAELIEASSVPFEDFLESCRRGEVKGVGAQLTKDLFSLSQTGRLQIYDELQSKFPEGLFDLATIPGLGAKKIRQLFLELGISNVNELLKACNENKLAKLKGFGEKSQAKFKEGALEHCSFQTKRLLPQAEKLIEELKHLLAPSIGEDVLEPVGEFRRKLPVLDSLELLVSGTHFNSALDLLRAEARLSFDEQLSPNHAKASTPDGFRVEFFRLSPESAPLKRVLLSGSEKHLEMVFQLPGLKLARSGETVNRSGKQWFPASEAEFYQECGLSYIPPECREGGAEISIARECFQSKKDFPPLVEQKDIRGIIHAHSHYSDGKNSLLDMALATRERGFEYFGVSDHSQSAAYANGLRIDAIKRQHDEIDEINERLKPFRIFKGIEADILDDGRLDYEDTTLALFDFVIISVHSKFSLNEAEMTKRIILAINNPYTSILAHPTGRLLLKRKGYSVNLPAVLEAASAAKVAVEINANPRRLDLDWSYLAQAKKLGIPIAINPDAHSISNIDNISYGVSMAKKGFLTASDILNSRSREEISKFFAAKKPK